MSKLTTLAFLFLIVLPCSSQNKTKFSELKLIEPQKLQNDFDQMIEIMQMHPARNVFTSEAEWKTIISEQREKLSAPMSVAQFFDVCAQVVYRIRCGHTGLDLPENFWKKGDQPLFPLQVVLVNDSLLVREDSKLSTPGFSHIVSVNEKPVHEIVERIKTYISADGMNSTWKVARLNQSLNNFLSLYFNFAKEYNVVYQRKDGTQNSTRFNAITSGEFNKVVVSNEPLTYKLLTVPNTAVMGIHSFNYYRKDTVKFYQTINTFFTQVQTDNVKNLILDLRGNSGGDPFSATHLLSYLAKEPFVYYGETYDWCKNLSQPYPLKAKRFKGKLFVLIDGMCFSTTTHLLSVMKINNIGTIIGEEAGGTYTCNDSGRWFELKNSGLKLRMARQSFKTTANVLPRDRGVMPDHPVKIYSTDVLSGKDVVMESVLRMIAAN